jgi:hypothetical protein
MNVFVLVSSGALEMRDEGSQRCNLWITWYFKFARWNRAQNLGASPTRNVIIDFPYQTFHVWLPSDGGSAASRSRHFVDLSP